MLYIDEDTLNICVSYGNTIEIDFFLTELPEDVNVTPQLPGEEPEEEGEDILGPPPVPPPVEPFDQIYMAIDDLDGNEVFGKYYPIKKVETRDGDMYIWTLHLSHAESLTILPGDYTWDFTYYQRCVVVGGVPTSDGVVATPFCVQAKAYFKVQDTNSTTF